MPHTHFVKSAIILILISFNSFAQQPEWLWANAGSGASQDYATSIAVDANRNLYIAGWFTSDTATFGDTILINKGKAETSDIFIAKYDAAGLLLWAKNLGGTEDDQAINIKTNNGDGFFITGWFKSDAFSLGNTTLTNAGGSDLFIARFDTAGNALWAKSAGSDKNDEGNSICCDANGFVYLTGMFESAAISFGSITLTNTGGHDIYLACYDPSGKAMWAKNIGGENDDSGSIITGDDNGNIYLTGKFSSSIVSLGDTVLPNTSNDGSTGDIFLAKYDRTGKLVWGKSLGGTFSDKRYSITSDKTGNVYMTGWFKSDTVIFGCDTLMQCTILTRAEGVEYGDVFIAKYDTDGTPLWAQRAGGMARDYGFGITADPAGDVYLTGVFESNFISFDDIQLKNAGSSDIFVAKYNATGKAVWAKSIYGSAMIRTITTDLNGEVYLAGIFNSPQMRFGSTLLNNGGKGDVFVAKLK